MTDQKSKTKKWHQNNIFFGSLLVIFGISFSIPFLYLARDAFIYLQIRNLRTTKIYQANSISECKVISDKIETLEKSICSSSGCVLEYYYDYSKCLDNLPGGNPLK